ncbi:hypothetical protein Tco_1006244 [Tanacetum coccineum]|uniref:MAK10-like protein n=1 Tax=Tanacetum coccineum TaxID=301880 RepID=A0ABQ5FHD1_9ASTR
MGDENPIRTLGDYSKPTHEGYRNTIELPVGNNVVPLRSDTIRLVQNGCSFYGLWSEDPNQHLKDFLKLVDLLDLDGSITTCEDLTTRFLAQIFPPGRTAKLHKASQRYPYVPTTLWRIFIRSMDSFQGLTTRIPLSWHRPLAPRNSMASKSIVAISHVEREELRKKGIKSPSKLISPKYLSLASIKELDKNLSASKRVHFVNSIVILSKDSDTEEDVSSTNTCRHDLGKMTRGNKEVKKQGMEEDEMETDVEVEEVIEEEESEFETDEEIEEILEEEEEDENFNSFPTMKELSRHEWLLKNPRPPWAVPFAHTSKLAYDESLGLIRFAQRDDEVVFRMPQNTKELDLVSSLEKDKFEEFFVESLKVIFDEKKSANS